MEKKIYVKHQHRYTKEKATLYSGVAEYSIFDTYEELIYKEEDGIFTKIQLYEDYVQIKRNGEIHSDLKFVSGQKTLNLLKSSYGDFEVELFTYQYDKRNHMILLEYDIITSEEKDGYKIEIQIEEDLNELN